MKTYGRSLSTIIRSFAAPFAAAERIEAEASMKEVRRGSKEQGKEKGSDRVGSSNVLSGLKNTAVSKWKSALADVPAQIYGQTLTTTSGL